MSSEVIDTSPKGMGKRVCQSNAAVRTERSRSRKNSTHRNARSSAESPGPTCAKNGEKTASNLVVIGQPKGGLGKTSIVQTLMETLECGTERREGKSRAKPRPSN